LIQDGPGAAKLEKLWPSIRQTEGDGTLRSVFLPAACTIARIDPALSIQAWD
jgi:hypothetical protein